MAKPFLLVTDKSVLLGGWVGLGEVVPRVGNGERAVRKRRNLDHKCGSVMPPGSKPAAARGRYSPRRCSRRSFCYARSGRSWCCWPCGGSGSSSPWRWWRAASRCGTLTEGRRRIEQYVGERRQLLRI